MASTIRAARSAISSSRGGVCPTSSSPADRAETFGSAGPERAPDRGEVGRLQPMVARVAGRGRAVETDLVEVDERRDDAGPPEPLVHSQPTVDLPTAVGPHSHRIPAGAVRSGPARSRQVVNATCGTRPAGTPSSVETTPGTTRQRARRAPTTRIHCGRTGCRTGRRSAPAKDSGPHLLRDGFGRACRSSERSVMSVAVAVPPLTVARTDTVSPTLTEPIPSR